MNASPFERLERLAGRVTDGEVVFFVGAGFSVDSEKNTGSQLITRLLVRFEVLTKLLATEKLYVRVNAVAPFRADAEAAHPPFTTEEQIRRTAEGLRRTLLSTFHLEEGRQARYPTLRSDNITKLSGAYYDINDWMSSAFGEVIRAIGSLDNASALTDKAAVLEEQLLGGSLFEINSCVLDELPQNESEARSALKSSTHAQFVGEEEWNRSMAQILPAETWAKFGQRLTRAARRELGGAISPPPDYAALAAFGDSAGKALFLDSMGFADEAVMCGEPEASSPDAVMTSYKSTLRPRHHILARLAREGLCPTLLTTNYDLLIEGAYRLAGFELTSSRNSLPGIATKKYDPAEAQLPIRGFRRCVRVANAIQFFDHCVDHGTAQIFKIHGCVQQYREAREEPANWKYYLPTMVFTYREVQNWRGDSWSRDFLSTLLRTRTIAFLGYSAADPVIHDTFRTVYEEMAVKRAALPVRSTASSCPRSAVAEPVGCNAPAFFFGGANRREFHGVEILRAATRTVGPASTDLTDHPNYIDFYYESERERAFPTLDEALPWLYHCTLRNLQMQTLDTDLRRVGALLLQHPCAPQHVEAIRRNFANLRDTESLRSKAWTRNVQNRAEFRRMISWTNHFHINLLREMGLGEIIQRESRPNFALSKLRRWPWYFPASEHRDWTAWNVVIELALRRMIAEWRNPQAPDWLQDTPWVRAVDWERAAAVVFSVDQNRPAPVLLRLRATTFDGTRISSPMPGVRTCLTWDLHPNNLPWRTSGPGGTSSPQSVKIPTAEQIWAWAHGMEPRKCTFADLELFFGPRHAKNQLASRSNPVGTRV